MIHKALLKKELTECWQISAWITGALLILLLVLLRMEYLTPPILSHHIGWENRSYQTILTTFQQIFHWISITLGIGLAARQFSIPFLTKEWGFLLHRPVSRGSILASKATAAGLLSLPVLLLWIGIWLWATGSGRSAVPITTQMLMQGFILISWGMVVYCAAAAESIIPYKKSMSGTAFVLSLLLLADLATSNLTHSIIPLIGILIGLFSVASYGLFLKREF